MATRRHAKKKQSARAKSTRTRTTKKKSARKSGQKTAARGKSARGKSTKKTSPRKAAKRTLVAPRGDKRYVRRSAKGRFKESDDVSASLSADRRKRAKRRAKPGQGDKGD